jgi:2-polyprenyl-3-methyl-5-hydroxy-6-metoxy-1,4-benzoquinol methylase
MIITIIAINLLFTIPGTPNVADTSLIDTSVIAVEGTLTSSLQNQAPFAQSSKVDKSTIIRPDIQDVIELGFFLVFGALILAIVFHELQQLNNFVDERKRILRKALEDQIKEEPNFLLLIQSIGKNSKVTCSFKEILRMIDEVYAQLLKEVLMLRSRYWKVSTIGISAFSLWLVTLFFYSAPNLFHFKSWNLYNIISVSVLILLLLCALFLISQTRLFSRPYSSKRTQETALEHVVSYAYSKSFKDRGPTLRSEKNGYRFEARYQAVASTIDKTVSKIQQLTAQRLSEIKIIDIGCGDGQLELRLNPQLNILGIDVSETSIERAKKNDKQSIQHGNHRFNVQNALNLPFGEESFDLIIMVEVLEHFIQPEMRLSYLSKFLKVGGSIVATVPNISCQYNQEIAQSTKLAMNDKPLKNNPTTDIFEHFWIDSRTQGKFPHKLYSANGIHNIFKAVENNLKIVEGNPFLIDLNGELLSNDQFGEKKLSELDTFLIISRKEN